MLEDIRLDKGEIHKALWGRGIESLTQKAEAVANTATDKANQWWMDKGRSFFNGTEWIVVIKPEEWQALKELVKK